MNVLDRNNARDRWIRSFLAVLVLIAFGFGAILLYGQGSLVIFDADGVVKEVVLRDSSRQILATHLVGGLYATNAGVEGVA